MKKDFCHARWSCLISWIERFNNNFLRDDLYLESRTGPQHAGAPTPHPEYIFHINTSSHASIGDYAPPLPRLHANRQCPPPMQWHVYRLLRHADTYGWTPRLHPSNATFPWSDRDLVNQAAHSPPNSNTETHGFAIEFARLHAAQSTKSLARLETQCGAQSQESDLPALLLSSTSTTSLPPSADSLASPSSTDYDTLYIYI